MNNAHLQNLISGFSPQKLVPFLREKNRNFRPTPEKLYDLDPDQFSQGEKIGEIPFNLYEKLGVYTFRVTRNLSERTGKKYQYDLAKKVLKESDEDAGIFVFYDAEGSFRFSLVYANYLGTKRDWSTFRRFTYFVAKHLTNKTFKLQMSEGDFTSLDGIKEAFSVEKVTKVFYEEISNWYFWACQKSQFPPAAEREENGRQVAVIRLITRLIFVWFMREKGLIPGDLFNQKVILECLTDLDDNSSSYYLAILQNLFFTTLNTPMEKRQFRSNIKGFRGHNPDFGNQYKYRHQALIAQPGRVEDFFANIPFLNGGLFDCLDNPENRDYFDGFSDTKKNQPLVPNLLFFSPGSSADLNAEFGTSKKQYKVKGLFETLSAYNFTIDENTADDKEVALDPELLGRVFENLLASFNPETSTTARKATGSYYTPREIVDYMVDESIKAYLKQHLEDIYEIDKKLNWLLSQEQDGNPFTAKEVKCIVDLVDKVRIVDPAVGSGAFPMGALNRLVLILQKLDPDSKLWEQAQLDAALQIPDAQIRMDVREKIRKSFEEKNHDYGRKLHLIQKCIYGVDIQQIAVEIAKLRFFISLLVDETVDKEKNNWGIEPLPNLDFKIMQGNSLVSTFEGIDLGPRRETKLEQGGLFSGQGEKADLIRELQNRKELYQTVSDHEKKRDLQKEIDQYLLRIFKINALEQRQDYATKLTAIDRKYQSIPDQKVREKLKAIDKEKISKEMGININALGRDLNSYSTKQVKRDFYPWSLFFAEVFTEKKGFDLVIGNPPYLESRNKSFSNNQKDSFQIACKIRWGEESRFITRGADLLIYFFELALYLINESGSVALITQNAWLDTVYGRKFQQFLLRNSKVQRIVDSDYRYFPSGEGPNINTVISFIGHKENKASEGIEFTRYHVNISSIKSHKPLDKVKDDLVVSQKYYKYSENSLIDTKWGFLLGSSSLTIHLLSQLSKYYCPIEEIKNSHLFYGQGLNLTKDYYIDIEKFYQISQNVNALISIFTSDDGALFEIQKTSKFLIDVSKLSRNEKIMCKQIGVNLFDPNSTSKNFPVLIMPRGIGRHFCSLPRINCFSSSGVDIYDKLDNISTEVKMNLWLFFNSTVAWLMRETLGRKNLGGGMLKAEAVDLENLPVFFDFKQVKRIASIFDSLKMRKALSSVEEINTKEHQQIDELVFDSLDISNNDKKSIQRELVHTITMRESKSIT